MLETIVIALVALLLGLGIGFLLRKQVAQAKANSVEALAEKRLIEAKNKEKEILLQAKEKTIKIIDEAKAEEKERREEIKKLQERLEQRETMFDKKFLEFEDQKQKLTDKATEIQTIKDAIEQKKADIVAKLQTVANLSSEDAKKELFSRIEEEAKEELLAKKLKMDRENHDVYDEKARRVIIDAIQRTASNHAAETTSTNVDIPSDEIKGRIIGKEGRNIKTIEKLTGCEIIIDDTPDMILISGFSPIRRRVCHLALQRLIKDGRIQPAKIEEAVQEAKKELALDLKQAGEETVHKLGIIGLDPKLISIIGRLKYRTSYGQNILNHSVEVAHLSAIIAQEVGVDPVMAKKAGFFHDIGKAVDHENEGAHTEIGYKILKKFNIHEDIAQVALTHHDPNPELLLTKIVMAADAISASRVGSRRDSVEQYIARLQELEDTAKDFPGVDKAYAIQAGREVRIFINPSEVDDYQSYTLAKDIARRIENELQYPGEIKVAVIRETRAIEYAR